MRRRRLKSSSAENVNPAGRAGRRLGKAADLELRLPRAALGDAPDRVERVTGVPAKQIAAAANTLGEAATAMVLTGRGPELQSTGVNNVLAYINLALALGKLGRLFCGYGTLTGQGNGQGGR